jgi:hypothetical protein
LASELSEVEIRPGLVAEIHGLVQLSLRVEAIEDDGVDNDGDGLHDNFDDTADKGPIL